MRHGGGVVCVNLLLTVLFCVTHYEMLKTKAFRYFDRAVVEP